VQAVVLFIGFVGALAASYDGVFAEARAAYQAVELRKAAALFRDAADVAADDTQRRSDALLWSGVAAGQAGELAIARRAFDEALALRCIDALPTTVSPKVQDVFQEATSASGHTIPCPAPTAPPDAEPDAFPDSQPKTPPVDPPHRDNGGDDDGDDGDDAATTSPSGVQPARAFPLAAVVVGTGAVVSAAGAAIAVKSLIDIGVAADAGTDQVTAKALLDQGNAGLAIAGVVAAVGVVAIVAGVVGIAAAAPDDSDAPLQASP
jgi:hypothetical protein